MLSYSHILIACSIAGSVFYFLILLYFREGLNRIEAGNEERKPDVSVIVPARNEAAGIGDTLRALGGQTYPQDKLQIVLVNDRSTDETPAIMEDFASRNRNVRIVHVQAKEASDAPKKRAILKGIEHATGEIIVTTDADAVMHPQWIETLMRHYGDEVGLVFGYAPYRTDGPYTTLFHRLLALEYFASGAVAASAAGRSLALTGFGANFSYRKICFEEVGGFGEGLNHHSGDDDLLLNRIRTASSYRIRFAPEPESAVWNRPPENLKALIRQRIRFASKHLAYPGEVIAGLSLVYAVYVLVFLLILGAVFSSAFRIPLLIVLGIKTAGEWLFLRKGQDVLEKRNLLKHYPLAVLPHILYVVFFPILGQIMPRKW